MSGCGISEPQNRVVVFARIGSSLELLTKPPATETFRGGDGLESHILGLDGHLVDIDSIRVEIGLPADADDRQVMSRGLERWGTGLAGRLCGSASWIAWNARDREVVAVADRRGLRPVYWSSYGRKLGVGFRALDVARAVGRSIRVDQRSAVCFLYTSGQDRGRSFFEGVQRIEPGTVVTMTARGAVSERYWDLPTSPDRSAEPTSLISQLCETLQAIIPSYASGSRVAVTLSSGLDSATVAAVASAAIGAKELCALALASPSVPGTDESEGARVLADFLGASFLAVRSDLTLPGSAPPQPLPDLDTPFAPYYEVAWRSLFGAARSARLGHVMTGFHGDNLFGAGACVYADLLLSWRWKELARQARHQLRYYDWGVAALIKRQILQPTARHILPHIGRPRKMTWLSKRASCLWRELSNRGPRGDSPAHTARLRILSPGAHSWAAVVLDRIASEYNVEFRHPLADHRLADLAIRIPPEFAFRGGQSKWIQRQALRRWLPDSLLASRNKVLPKELFLRGFERLVGKRGREAGAGLCLCAWSPGPAAVQEVPWSVSNGVVPRRGPLEHACNGSVAEAS